MMEARDQVRTSQHKPKMSSNGELAQHTQVKPK